MLRVRVVMLRRLLLAVCVTGAALALAPAAMAAGWSVRSTLNPSGATSAALPGVSCVLATWCIGVGYYTNSSGADVTLAEASNGGSWSIQGTPNPGGSSLSLLTGVDCTAINVCTAVGHDYNSSGVSSTLAEARNGGSWSIQSTPNPTGSTGSTLINVSCWSASGCIAVGDYKDASGAQLTLAERWNGSSWTMTSTPNPSGATSSVLNSVSCTSSTSCFAVGASTSSSTQTALAEYWNGSSWTIYDVLVPVGATQSRLDGVSCTAASTCEAVGEYIKGSEVTLTESYNGTSWNPQTSPNPSGAKESLLNGISCTAASTCNAVGQEINSAGVYVTLAEGWNGSVWSLSRTPNPAGAQSSYLVGVSCVSATSCVAGGGTSNSSGTQLTLAEQYAPRWTMQAVPTPGDGASLSGVSCLSDTSCVTVGNYTPTGGGAAAPLAETWNGSSWTSQFPPTPVAAVEGANLIAVSCPSPGRCTAVGRSTDSSGTGTPLAEAWNGTAWTVEPTPVPSGATSSILSSVSCTSPNACTAVGTYDAPGYERLVERWNGDTWTIQTTPDPAGGNAGRLIGVDCTSPTTCVAVGEYYNSTSSYAPLAETWNGTGWTAQTPPIPTGASLSSLTGISCTSASSCTATGDNYHGPGVETTLAEILSGGSWSIESTPNPAGLGFDALSGVSCSSASACATVGYSYTSANVLVPLAEIWNGTNWSTAGTPYPAGATNGTLQGVACTGATACTAVGTYFNGGTGYVTLVERYS